jgi:hypothetical protein
MYISCLYCTQSELPKPACFDCVLVALDLMCADHDQSAGHIVIQKLAGVGRQIAMVEISLSINDPGGGPDAEYVYCNWSVLVIESDNGHLSVWISIWRHIGEKHQFLYKFIQLITAFKL